MTLDLQTFDLANSNVNNWKSTLGIDYLSNEVFAELLNVWLGLTVQFLFTTSFLQVLMETSKSSILRAKNPKVTQNK